MKRLKKRTMVILALAVLAAESVSLFNSILADNHRTINQEMYQLGKEIAQSWQLYERKEGLIPNSQEELDDRVIATVNGEKLYYAEYLSRCKKKYLYQQLTIEQIAQRPLPSDPDAAALITASLEQEGLNNQKAYQETLEHMIHCRLIFQDCERLGITVTKEEAKAVLDQQEAMLKEFLEEGQTIWDLMPASTYEAIYSMNLGAGLTEAEYQKIVAEETRLQMMRGRHKTQICREKGVSEEELYTPEADETYDVYLKTLWDKSDVFIDQDLVSEGEKTLNAALGTETVQTTETMQ